jgi:hypothetical protein
MAIAPVIAHLRAGDWKSAHAIVQKDASVLGCWAHGIVHAMEGDMDNARYWYRRARRGWPEHFDVPGELAALAAACEEKA